MPKSCNLVIKSEILPQQGQQLSKRYALQNLIINQIQIKLFYSNPEIQVMYLGYLYKLKITHKYIIGIYQTSGYV